jgi:hypothetical protein
MRRRVAVGFGIGFVLSLALLVLTINATGVPPAELGIHGYVHDFSPPADGFEVLLLQGDGQAYASIAQDPLLQRPDHFAEGRAQEAFFAQRPLYSYGGWVLSVGRPARLELAFVLLSGIAGGILVAAATALLDIAGAGRSRWSAPLLLLIPNVAFAARAFTPDILATGLVLAGLAFWLRDSRRKGWAVILFVLAVLARESTLVVPVVLVGFELWHRRLRVRHLAVVAAPLAAYVLWMAFVRHQLQSGPGTIARNTSFAAPFVGLREGASHWTSTDAVMVVVMVGLLVVVAAMHRRRVESWMIAAYLAASVVLNGAIWQSWVDIGRVFVPGAVLALVLVVPRTEPTAEGLPFSSPSP